VKKISKNRPSTIAIPASVLSKSKTPAGKYFFTVVLENAVKSGRILPILVVEPIPRDARL